MCYKHVSVLLRVFVLCVLGGVFSVRWVLCGFGCWVLCALYVCCIVFCMLCCLYCVLCVVCAVCVDECCMLGVVCVLLCLFVSLCCICVV